MHTDILVRPAAAEDIPAVAGMEQVCFPQDPWPAELFPRFRHRILVAEEDGLFLGYLVFSHVLDEGAVDNIAVRPEARRRGAADALLRHFFGMARELGLATVTLEVRASNTPAVRLYEKHGFVTVGRRRGYYERPKEDAVLMTKELELC